MRFSRRSFLRLAAAAPLLAARDAGASDRAPAIHAQTRNTPLGALGRKRTPPEGPGPFKAYAGAARTALPAPAAPSGRSLAGIVRSWAPTSGFSAEPLSLDQLSRLLFHANGVTGRAFGRPLRAAPSAGALYAGELYVAAERVNGLPPGLYYYGVLEHELALLRPGPVLGRIADACERPAALAGAAAAVILTNVFRRYTTRYRNRGYRYALIDSGHIGENLRLGARSMGLGEAAPLRFHDAALEALLGVDGAEEAVCAVHLLGAPGEAGSGGRERPLAERQSVDPEVRRGPGPVTRRYHQATKLVPGEHQPEPSVLAPDAALPARFRVALSGSPGPDLPLEQAVRRRRSALAFRTEPIDRKELAFVLEAARRHDALERAPGVDLYVAAHRVTGLRPGLYRYEAGGLAGLHTRDLRVALTRACGGQRKAGSAAAALMMAARFDTSGASLGTRRYRDQLLEAGAVAQRIYLAAESLGLAARNLAAFLDDDLERLCGLASARAGVLHLTVVGREA